MPWIWKTCCPKSGFSTAWTLTASTSATPASLSALRTSSTLASCASAVWIFVPDSKSIPKLSWLVANESAPMTRMTPEIEKNQRLAPAKSKCQRTRCSPAPRKAGERRILLRPSRPSTARVKTTAVSSETSVPIPSVNAKPLTPAVASPKRMNAVSSVITFASMIVPIPRL